VILALSTALSGFLIWRVANVTEQIREVNVQAATENGIGITLSSQVATVQQAVDRYLQQPTSAHKINANTELQKLKTLIEQTGPQFSNPQHLTALGAQLKEYNQSFLVLVILNDLQRDYWFKIDQGLSRADNALAGTIEQAAATSQTGVSNLGLLSQCQTHLYTASSGLVHLVNLQQALWGQNAREQLQRCTERLNSVENPDDATREALDRALSNIATADTAITSYMQGIDKTRTKRDVLLNEQGTRLKRLSDDISNSALQQVTAVGYELEHQSLQLRQVALGASLVTLLLTVALGFQIARAISLPLKRLVGATHQLQQGNYTGVDAALHDQSEIGLLAGAFHTMAQNLQGERAEVTRQQRELKQHNEQLQQAYQELRQATEAREQMAATVRLLSVPVIPVLQGVIVLPLVGEIDTERAQSLMGRITEGVVAHRARMVILDITGVPFVDSHTAQMLQRAAASAKLLGARCVLVGVTPEVAQTLVSSGSELAEFTTMADLRSATAYALRTA
jgi:anti-anti-sigma factor